MVDEGQIEAMAPTRATPHAVRERLVVAPAAGRFRGWPPETVTDQGEWVGEGQQLGRIDCGSDQIPVRSPFGGWLVGSLVRDNEPVEQGQSLFRIGA